VSTIEAALLPAAAKMMEIQKSVAPAASSSSRGSMAHLLWFFALVYVAEGAAD
jgi:hypothetical protein